MPAGTIEPGEAAEDAVVREIRYDVWPSKPEVHERHFFQLALLDDDPPER
ncbi:NUDIX domain-containing protein [Microbacterium sp.]